MDLTSEQAKLAISENINRRLIAIGWSRYRLSQETGISEQTIGSICGGTHEPRFSFVVTIARALDLSLNSIAELPQKKLGKSEKKIPA